MTHCPLHTSCSCAFFRILTGTGVYQRPQRKDVRCGMCMMLDSVLALIAGCCCGCCDCCGCGGCGGCGCFCCCGCCCCCCCCGGSVCGTRDKGCDRTRPESPSFCVTLIQWSTVTVGRPGVDRATGTPGTRAALLGCQQQVRRVIAHVCTIMFTPSD